MSDTIDRDRERIAEMLRERGVDGVVSIAGGITDIDAAYGAIKWWDDLPHSGLRAVSTGLLVNALRDGGKPGYKRPHERTEVEGSVGWTDGLRTTFRGIGLSPDGFTRDEMRAMKANVAASLNTPVDSLIDDALDPNWMETPRHPAKHLREYSDVRYAAWVGGWGRDVKIDAAEGWRRKGETDWDFACRFWSWTEPEDLIERVRKARLAAMTEQGEERDLRGRVKRPGPNQPMLDPPLPTSQPTNEDEEDW